MEIIKSIQDTVNTININASFDENLGTMMKLYFFIKRLKILKPQWQFQLKEITIDPLAEEKKNKGSSSK